MKHSPEFVTGTSMKIDWSKLDFWAPTLPLKKEDNSFLNNIVKKMFSNLKSNMIHLQSNDVIQVIFVSSVL